MDQFPEPVAPSEAQTFAILGGSGFIGTRVARRLCERGMPFRIGDLRQSSEFPQFRVECDVTRPATLEKLLCGAAAIINLAAEHRDDVRPVERYYKTNVEGAANVCDAASRAGVRRIIFTSSVAVYGFHPGPVDENGPFEPFNDYGKTKLQAEHVYLKWAAEDPSRTLVIVRPTVVFGEGNRGNVYNLIRQVASGRFLMVGSGSNIKSMAYVGNIAEFLIYVLGLGSGVHICNYVDGPDMSTRELIAQIDRALGRSGKVPGIPKTVALAGGHFFDLMARLSGRTFPVSAIRVRKFCESTQFRAARVAQSGFVPPYSLRDGLIRTIRFEFGSDRLAATG